MHVQLLRRGQITTYSRYQPGAVELLGSHRVEVRSKDVDCLYHGLGSPQFGASHLDYFPPGLQVRDYLEGFGHLPAAVSSKDLAYFSVDTLDFRVV